jgi:two-component system sensor histidine kinase UhpB
MPISSKVLIANAIVVVTGAIGGTWLTATFIEHSVSTNRAWLMLVFASIGVFLSVLVNYRILKAAFEPLENLERVAEAVRMGDFSARTDAARFTDPQLERFGQSFNRALNVIEQDREQIRQLADRVIDAQEQERKRIARELHDDTAQLLFAQLLRVSALSSSPHPEVRETAEQIGEMMSEAMENVRRLGHELRPPALDDLGLRAALEDLSQRMSDQMGIPVTFETTEFRRRVEPAVELVLYRVAQEALTNTWKHAKATQVKGMVVRMDDGVKMVIEDDGVGFDANAVGLGDGQGLGMGLFGMEERVELVGGTLTIDGAIQSGTRVTAFIPLQTPPQSLTINEHATS